MCLVVVAHRVDPEFPLIVAGNRDEFHGRPTQDARWWPDRPTVLGGRDLQANGTWLAIDTNGRFATVTNHRDAQIPSAKLRSRGHLITDFLQSDLPPLSFAEQIDGEQYGGFNLLMCDGKQLVYRSNRGGGCRELAPGIYGVANATLDTAWPKVRRSTNALHALITERMVNPTRLLTMLNDREKASASEIDAKEIPFEKAHALSAPFIVLPEYGTRCSTILLRNTQDRVALTEKRFAPDGVCSGQSDFSFSLQS